MHMKNTKKKTLTGLLICIFLIAALFLGGKLLFYHVSDAENIWYFSGDTAQRIENIQMLPEHALDDYDSLMVVAHPDDETIWGGAHLLKGKYVVVCITNGNNRTRRKEFAAVMKQTDSIGLMLSFPDKTHGKRNNWESCREEIQQSIDTIVAQKDWATIATHNSKGEYGHIHHQMTSAITTAAAKKADLMNHLYYFGTYVKAKNMEKQKKSAISHQSAYRQRTGSEALSHKVLRFPTQSHGASWTHASLRKLDSLYSSRSHVRLGA